MAKNTTQKPPADPLNTAAQPGPADIIPPAPGPDAGTSTTPGGAGAPDTGKKPAEEPVVTMSKTEYETLMKTIGDMKDKIDYVSDKARIERWEASQNKGKSILPIAGLKTLDGKFIVGWKTISNEAEFRNNLYIERQIIEVAYEDQSFHKMDYVDFVRQTKKVSGEVIKKMKQDDEEFWTIRFPDGKELTVNITFLN